MILVDESNRKWFDDDGDYRPCKLYLADPVSDTSSGRL